MVHGFIWPMKSCMNSGFPRFQMPGQGAGSRPLRLSTQTGAKPHQDAGATPDAYRPRDMPVRHVSNSTFSTEPAAPETCRSLPRPHPQPELGRSVGSRRPSESLGRGDLDLEPELEASPRAHPFLGPVQRWPGGESDATRRERRSVTDGTRRGVRVAERSLSRRHSLRLASGPEL